MSFGNLKRSQPQRVRAVRPCALIVFLVFLAGGPLLAEGPYLVSNRLDSVALLAPPPAPQSQEQAADLASVRAAFQARSAAEEARAKADNNLSLFLFARAVGPELAPGKFPKTEALFKEVKKEIGEPIDVAKDHWKRLRPYQVDENLSFGWKEKSFSYPSGHATRGTVYAWLLAEIFPEHREAVLQVGREIGWDRVLIGMHFPTDIQAGRVLGRAIVRELQTSPAFQHDLAEAKAEAQATARSQASEAKAAGAGQ